jgi:Peptidase A4 family
MLFRKAFSGGLLATLLSISSTEIGEGGLNRALAAGASAAPSHIPMILHQRHGKNASSSNWGGYAVTGPNGSVSDVKASWIVPEIVDKCPATNQYASFWVGIDGYSSNTVEQIGTESDCQNGQPVYYVWYEFYPHWAFTVNTVTIRPGDFISAEVSVTGKGTFTVSLTNETTTKSFSASAKMNNADRSSAEWIAEAPWSGGVLPLANFRTAFFGSQYTAVPDTSSVTMKIGNSTSTGSIGSFPANSAEITMVDKNGDPKAIPTGLSVDGSSFSIGWASAGP